MAYAVDLKSAAERIVGSTPTEGTKLRADSSMVERDTHNVLVAGSIPARPIYIHTVVPSYKWTSICNSFIIGYEREKQYSSNVMQSEWLCNYITMVNKEMVDCINKLVAMSKALDEHICSKCLVKTEFNRSMCIYCQFRRIEYQRRIDDVWKKKDQYWLSDTGNYFISANSIRTV